MRVYFSNLIAIVVLTPFIWSKNSEALEFTGFRDVNLGSPISSFKDAFIYRKSIFQDVFRRQSDEEVSRKIGFSYVEYITQNGIVVSIEMLSIGDKEAQSFAAAASKAWGQPAEGSFLLGRLFWKGELAQMAMNRTEGGSWLIRLGRPTKSIEIDDSGNGSVFEFGPPPSNPRRSKGSDRSGNGCFDTPYSRDNRLRGSKCRGASGKIAKAECC